MASSTKPTRPAVSWHKTPKDILCAILQAQKGVVALQAIAEKEKVERKFTLDGRLVGDIGELIVARYFDVIPGIKPKGHAHDLYAMIGGARLGVQVKLRREATKGAIEFKYQPQVLIVLIFKSDWSEWRICYHGSGEIVNQEGILVDHGTFRFRRGNETAVVSVNITELANSHGNSNFAKPAMTPRSR